MTMINVYGDQSMRSLKHKMHFLPLLGRRIVITIPYFLFVTSLNEDVITHKLCDVLPDLDVHPSVAERQGEETLCPPGMAPMKHLIPLCALQRR